MDGLGDAKRRETPCSPAARAPGMACLGELGCAQLIYINSSPLMMSYRFSFLSFLLQQEHRTQIQVLNSVGS